MADRGVSLREQQRAQTRERLMEAALTLFGDKGYVQTSVEDICAAIGASRATFYLHFKSKRDVLVARYADWRPEWIARYRELDDAVMTPGNEVHKAVREWLAGWLDFWQNNRPLLRSIREAAVVEPEILAELGDPYFLADAMQRYLKSLAADQREPARQGIALLEVMTAEAFEFMLMQKGQLDHDEALSFLTDMWCERLQAPRSGAKPQRAVRRGGHRVQ